MKRFAGFVLVIWLTTLAGMLAYVAVHPPEMTDDGCAWMPK